MKIRRLGLIATMATVGALLLVACGGDSDDGADRDTGALGRGAPEASMYSVGIDCISPV